MRRSQYGRHPRIARHLFIRLRQVSSFFHMSLLSFRLFKKKFLKKSSRITSFSLSFLDFIHLFRPNNIFKFFSLSLSRVLPAYRTLDSIRPRSLFQWRVIELK